MTSLCMCFQVFETTYFLSLLFQMKSCWISDNTWTFYKSRCRKSCHSVATSDHHQGVWHWFNRYYLLKGQLPRPFLSTFFSSGLLIYKRKPLLCWRYVKSNRHQSLYYCELQFTGPFVWLFLSLIASSWNYRCQLYIYVLLTF